MMAAMLLCIRRVLRREGISRDRSYPLQLENEILLRQYRFPREEILNIADLLQRTLEKPTHRSQPVPVELQVCVALRFYASGSCLAECPWLRLRFN